MGMHWGRSCATTMATVMATVSTCFVPTNLPCSKLQIQTTRATTMRQIMVPAFQLSSSREEENMKKKKRGWAVVTRAGPSSTSVVFAFVFPLTLLVVTILTSLRISDQLDEKFREEIAINEAILDGKDENEEDGLKLAEEMPTPALTRARNRPKREA